MRLAFFGDVIGASGREGVLTHLPVLRRRLSLDFVVVNAENAAGGFGITEKIANEILDAGADAITLGNHTWDQREALTFLDREPRVLRPANYPRLSRAPATAPGSTTRRAGGACWWSACWAACTWTRWTTPSPRWTASWRRVRWARGADAVVVDVHAEITSEKMAMGHFCDGRASLVVGTHTHVPTADAQVLPGGTAYQTDAGGCCDYDSVIGMAKGGAGAPLRHPPARRALRPRHRTGNGVRRVRGDRRPHRAGAPGRAHPRRRRLKPAMPQVEASVPA